MSKKENQDINNGALIQSTEDQLTHLLDGIALDDIKLEVQLLHSIKKVDSNTFKQKLEELCGDYRLDLNLEAVKLTSETSFEDAVILIEDETDVKVDLPLELRQQFLDIAYDDDHWMNSWLKLTKKEILLILYKFPELGIV